MSRPLSRLAESGERAPAASPAVDVPRPRIATGKLLLPLPPSRKPASLHKVAVAAESPRAPDSDLSPTLQQRRRYPKLHSCGEPGRRAQGREAGGSTSQPRRSWKPGFGSWGRLRTAQSQPLKAKSKSSLLGQFGVGVEMIFPHLGLVDFLLD